VHGILTPVWDIATENVADIAEEVRAFAQRFAAAVADISELTTDQRRSRAAVVGKHVTIRK
jgi:methyl-accepting chemotaxis protein